MESDPGRRAHPWQSHFNQQKPAIIADSCTCHHAASVIAPIDGKDLRRTRRVLAGPPHGNAMQIKRLALFVLRLSPVWISTMFSTSLQKALDGNNYYVWRWRYNSPPNYCPFCGSILSWCACRSAKTIENKQIWIKVGPGHCQRL